MDNPVILVVDDQYDICIMLKNIFETNHYSVLTANNGLEALQLLREHIINLIISDINMPKMDGFSLLLLIKKQYPRLPVILITGYYDYYLMEYIIEKGADGFLHKPFNSNEILKLISKKLGEDNEKQSSDNQRSHGNKY